MFYKIGQSRQHNQPAHSEVLECQQCTIKTTKDEEDYPWAHQIRHQYLNYTNHLSELSEYDWTKNINQIINQ